MGQALFAKMLQAMSGLAAAGRSHDTRRGEDQRKLREYLAALIDGSDGFRCTGSFRSMEEAVARIGADLPDRARRLDGPGVDCFSRNPSPQSLQSNPVDLRESRR